jgi:hypothetical protein
MIVAGGELSEERGNEEDVKNISRHSTATYFHLENYDRLPSGSAVVVEEKGTKYHCRVRTEGLLYVTGDG